ncbi:hypothetical protein D1818_01330 [Aquimarina sp. BL5]|uniref:hypothetical protein n=1 Tax=Aquimarina sp. BL5 TaxID=1714860 RepID=UPI000E4F0B6C|nr:hypothetical protein [Aquimarina sp. BL5]AXT49526.1 hypothetical protein D1818_01330 [Aquimarina sp. BL5]RKM96246.1 hypothetical protein D7036_21055 [Aquimarina sp. BL5]
MIKFKYNSMMILLLLLISCSSDDSNNAVIEEGGNAFFNFETIEIDRSSSQPIVVELRYQGPKRNQDIMIPYTVSFPSENAAIEGEDFLLPQSDFLTIKRGTAIARVNLLQRVINNQDALQNRFVMFNLQPTEGLTIGDASNMRSSITISLNPAVTPVEIDPNDPLDFIGDKKFSITVENTSLKIPYFSDSEDITDTSDENIKRAIIALHGSGRNARGQYENILEAARLESDQLDSFLIIAPQFLEEEDINNFALDEEHLYWSSIGWRIGFTSRDEDTNPRPERASSYTVMDAILENISEYPNLETIVLTGHSAGAQFVNRYSASSPYPDELIAQGIDIQFVTNNPGSYVYMDDKRKVLGTESIYAVPTSNCPEYNEYRYGLDDLPSYLRNIGGEDVIRDRLAQRKVTYLIGQNDNDPNFEGFDDSCNAVLQGRDRFERAINYFGHLIDFYGTVIEQNQKIEIVPGVGHSSNGMYTSEVGRRNIFRN